MRLLLLRHGRAIEREDWIGLDALRPLTRVGRRRTRDVVRAAAPLVTGFAAVWTSPWRRAHQTARLAATAWGLPLEELPWLAGDGPGAGDLLPDLPREDTVLVGHEPNLGELLGVLVGGPPVALKKAGLALLCGEPVAGGMTLSLLLPPRALLALA